MRNMSPALGHDWQLFCWLVAILKLKTVKQGGSDKQNIWANPSLHKGRPGGGVYKETKRNRGRVKPEEGHSKEFLECAYYFWPFISFCQWLIAPYYTGRFGNPSVCKSSLEQTPLNFALRTPQWSGHRGRQGCLTHSRTRNKQLLSLWVWTRSVEKDLRWLTRW